MSEWVGGSCFDLICLQLCEPCHSHFRTSLVVDIYINMRCASHLVFILTLFACCVDGHSTAHHFRAGEYVVTVLDALFSAICGRQSDTTSVVDSSSSSSVSAIHTTDSESSDSELVSNAVITLEFEEEVDATTERGDPAEPTWRRRAKRAYFQHLRRVGHAPTDAFEDESVVTDSNVIDGN